MCNTFHFDHVFDGKLNNGTVLTFIEAEHVRVGNQFVLRTLYTGLVNILFCCVFPVGNIFL